jgi:hypothetical protein
LRINPPGAYRIGSRWTSCQKLYFSYKDI